MLTASSILPCAVSDSSQVFSTPGTSFSNIPNPTSTKDYETARGAVMDLPHSIMSRVPMDKDRMDINITTEPWAVSQAVANFLASNLALSTRSQHQRRTLAVLKARSPSMVSQAMSSTEREAANLLDHHRPTRTSSRVITRCKTRNHLQRVGRLSERIRNVQRSSVGQVQAQRTEYDIIRVAWC